jgi:hypothetical protein
MNSLIIKDPKERIKKLRKAAKNYLISNKNYKVTKKHKLIFFNQYS